jgi:hypothetical protein
MSLIHAERPAILHLGSWVATYEVGWRNPEALMRDDLVNRQQAFLWPVSWSRCELCSLSFGTASPRILSFPSRSDATGPTCFCRTCARRRGPRSARQYTPEKSWRADILKIASQASAAGHRCRAKPANGLNSRHPVFEFQMGYTREVAFVVRNQRGAVLKRVSGDPSVVICNNFTPVRETAFDLTESLCESRSER